MCLHGYLANAAGYFTPAPEKKKRESDAIKADNDTAGVSIWCTRKQKKSGINDRFVI